MRTAPPPGTLCLLTLVPPRRTKEITPLVAGRITSDVEALSKALVQPRQFLLHHGKHEVPRLGSRQYYKEGPCIMKTLKLCSSTLKIARSLRMVEYIVFVSARAVHVKLGPAKIN